MVSGTEEQGRCREGGGGAVISGRVVSVGLGEKASSKQRLTEGIEPCRYPRDLWSSQGNSQCKGLEAGLC